MYGMMTTRNRCSGLFVVTIGLFIICGNAYKILVIPAPGTGHVSEAVAIGRALTGRGHNVTMLLGEGFKFWKELPSSITLERYRFEKGEEIDYAKLYKNYTDLYLCKNYSVKDMVAFVIPWMAYDSNTLLLHNDPLFEKLKNVGFDLALVDGLFANKYFYLVPHRLGVPWVTYVNIVEPFLNGAPDLPSFVPHQLTTYTDRMAFIERLSNTVTYLMLHFVKLLPDPTNEILEKYRGYGSFETIDELSSRSLMWLITRDVVLDYPKPSMPNIVDVGGLTTGLGNGQLTDELEKFMSDGKSGVILVTFGSMVYDLPVRLASKFVSAFRRLPDFKIIWRFDNTKTNLSISENVLLAEWLPQNDILADARVKLFITHCGSNGQFEAIYHGVPMIAFPTHADQPYNAARLHPKGYGIAMNFQTFTPEELVTNVKHVIGDKSFKERTMLASKIFKSRPETPSERAAFWIEHVIKFGGEYLRSAGTDLYLFQYYMLDVLLFLIIGIAIAVWFIGQSLKFLCQKCRRVDKHSVKLKGC